MWTRGQYPAAPPQAAIDDVFALAVCGGGETGSTRVVKIRFSFGEIPPISVHKLIDANDNVESFELKAVA